MVCPDEARSIHYRDAHLVQFPELRLGPATLLPTRNLSFPERDNLSWHDITPKSNFVWDVTGTGKTAVKVSLNKYLEVPDQTHLVAANADFRHRCRRPRGSDEVVHPQRPAPARRSSRVAC